MMILANGEVEEVLKCGLVYVIGDDFFSFITNKYR